MIDVALASHRRLLLPFLFLLDDVIILLLRRCCTMSRTLSWGASSENCSLILSRARVSLTNYIEFLPRSERNDNLSHPRALTLHHHGIRHPAAAINAGKQSCTTTESSSSLICGQCPVSILLGEQTGQVSRSP